jgi:hypothetical protein
MLGGFSSTEKGYAVTQATTNNVDKTDPQALMTWASNYYFIQAITSLQNEVSTQGVRHGKGIVGREAEYASFLDENRATTNAIITAKNVFKGTFASPQATGKTATLIYKDALTSANQSLLTQKNGNPLLQRAYPASILDLLSKQIVTESSDQEFIAALNDGKALSSAAQNASAAVTGAANPKPPAKCSLLTGSTWTDCLDVGATWLIKSFFLELAGFLLWTSANLMNMAMQAGIFNFKNFAPDEIYSIWLVIRQTISLFIFFAALYMGFMAVIGKSQDFKRYVAFFIIYGLFVNFSYPLVRVFVDVSNIVSLQIYEATFGPGILKAQTDGADTAGARIISAMGLNGLVAGATSIPGSAGGTSDFINKVTTTPGALAAVAFVVYSAYVFFMMSILIIVRTALLVFLIIGSPILLIDTVVPGLGERAAKLRTIFFSQLILGPIFTIMLALTLKFMEVFQKLPVGATSITVFFNLIMMLVMLHISLKVTKDLSGSVGESAMKWAGKAAGLAGGLSLAGAAAGGGIVGRNTLGRMAGAAVGSTWMDNLQGSRAGRFAKAGLTGISNSSLDARNIGLIQSGARAAGLTNVGKGAQRGFAAQRAATEESRNTTLAGIQNDEARTQAQNQMYSGFGIQRASLNALGAGADKLGLDGNRIRNITTLNEKAIADIKQADDAALKQYVNADKEGRKKLAGDEKNKQYLERYKKIDTYLTSSDKTEKDAIAKDVGDVVKDELDKKLSKTEVSVARNNDLIASYFTANTATRDNMYANAANNPELLKKLDLIDNLRNLKNTDPNNIQEQTRILTELNDSALATKIMQRDTHEGSSDAIAAKQTIYQQVTTNYGAPAQLNATDAKRELDDAVDRKNIEEANLTIGRAQADATSSLAAAVSNQAAASQAQAAQQDQVLQAMLQQMQANVDINKQVLAALKQP